MSKQPTVGVTGDTDGNTAWAKAQQMHGRKAEAIDRQRQSRPSQKRRSK
jgi:hypothetical protein